ncbi:13137_t:CDS:2 [Gigaspora margarita]|uniref:13137_t:CDS:1 n=1 Tax=Gigaspora margarita TaxID=4874 RepID=A0ABN7V1R5_GIGMA|nr:13137_t:CDS:2 [Gigaspora margarita]
MAIPATSNYNTDDLKSNTVKSTIIKKSINNSDTNNDDQKALLISTSKTITFYKKKNKRKEPKLVKKEQNTEKNLKQRIKSVNMVKPTMTKKVPNNSDTNYGDQKAPITLTPKAITKKHQFYEKKEQKKKLNSVKREKNNMRKKYTYIYVD